MSGLFSSLSSTANALDAQQRALETVGQNLANIDTPGYALRTVNFSEIAPAQDGSGGGVTVASVDAVRDAFTQQRLSSAQPLASQQSTIADLTSVAQSAVGVPGQSLDADLSSFFSAWSQLASDPTSASARQVVVSQGQALGQSFSQISDQLTAVQTQASTQVRSTVDDINSLASQIASLNAGLVSAGGPTTPEGQTVLDQAYAAVDSLSSDLQINVLQQQDGQINISYAGGRALVVGSNTYGLTVAGGSGGVFSADGADVTSELTTGSLGGALQVRDTTIPGYLQQLDTLASTVVQQVNTMHQAGYDLNGTAGGNFFTPIASVTGAAGLVAVNPSVVADPSTVAAAATTAPGDNQNARNIANLANTAVIGSATLAQGWGNLIYQIGQDVKSAQDNTQTYTGVVNQLQSLKDATSGVSLNEEAATLMKYQRAYQANAQFFATINTTLDTLFTMAATV